MDPQPDLYISADVETDGPIPGPYSMLSFGLTVVGSYDGRRLERPSGERATFYRELRPISDEFQDEALAVNGLDRDWLIENGAGPSPAMEEAAQWVRQQAGDRKPVLVASRRVRLVVPLLVLRALRRERLAVRFLIVFRHPHPYQASAGTVHGESGNAMPAALMPASPHTHNALDDAIEQGELFANVFEWVARRRDGGSSHGSRSNVPPPPAWLAGHVGR